MSQPLRTPTVTIPVGATGLSGVVYIGMSELVGYLIGPDWQTADITLQACPTPDGTFGEVKLATDASVETLKAAATIYYTLPTPLKIGPWIKIRSGTSGSPVNQTTAATIQLVLRSLEPVRF
jgi:hypothetical protein